MLSAQNLAAKLFPIKFVSNPSASPNIIYLLIYIYIYVCVLACVCETTCVVNGPTNWVYMCECVWV